VSYSLKKTKTHTKTNKKQQNKQKKPPTDLATFLKELARGGRRGGKRSMTYFAGTASRSSQMPLLLYPVDRRGRWG